MNTAASMHLGAAEPSGNADLGMSTRCAPTGPKILLTIAECGELLGVSERKAHEVLPELVELVVLGPRCVRVVRAELELAVTKLPRQKSREEPAQLLRSKIERLKRTGVAA